MPSQSPRAATQGPASQRKRPGDLTGVRGQKLAEERDQAQEEAAAAAAAAKVQERETALNTVVDYTGSPNAARPDATVAEPELHPETMRIRVNYPIEEMTWGREVLQQPEFDDRGALVKAAVLGGLRTYAFEEGKQYDVPWELGEHLKGLQYVYDF